jgi:hypothetical protein
MLERTIQDFVTQGLPFTGYDVTVTTREREKIELLHRKVRNDIHQLAALQEAFDYDDYVQSNLRAPNGQPVILYHPQNYNVADYKFMDGSSASSPVSIPNTPLGYILQAANDMVQAASPNGNGNSTTTVDDGTFGLDYRNRLMVPTRFLRDLGVKPYDHIYVIADAAKNQIQIHTAHNPPTNGVMQMVERNGDVRLANKTLSGAGLNSNKFNIEIKDLGNDRVIEITKA